MNSDKSSSSSASISPFNSTHEPEEEGMYPFSNEDALELLRNGTTDEILEALGIESKMDARKALKRLERSMVTKEARFQKRLREPWRR
jgi:hypothetical protein